MTVAWYEDFTAGIADGTGTYRRCPECESVGLPPRRTCPACGHPELDSAPLSTEATVVTWTEINNTIPKFVDSVPYIVAISEFPEGVRLTGQYVSDARPTIGEAVHLDVEIGPDGESLIVFRPTNAN